MFGRNLKYLRKKHGLEQMDLAEKLGRKSASTISEWEKGKYTPKLSTLNEISKIFNVEIDDLMNIDLSLQTSKVNNDITTIYNKLNSDRQQKVIKFAETQLEEQNSNIVDLREYKDVYIQSKLSAGTGIVDLDQQHQELISYKGYVPKDYDLAFEVCGDSMEPLFKSGEVIFVKADKEVRNGQIGVVVINDNAYVKKMYVEDNKLRLVSLNKKYDDIIADENIQIVGRAII